MTDFTGQKALNYDTELRQGRIPGQSLVRVSAITESAGVVRRAVWGGSGEYIFDYTNPGEAWEIVSTSANDTVGGSGAEEVTLIIIKDDYTQTTKTVTLDGLTPVPVLIDDNQTINDFYVSAITPGSYSDGDIICSVVGGDERGIIKAGKNRADDGIAQVPLGFTWLLNSAVVNSGKGGDGRFIVETASNINGVWLERAILSLYQGAEQIPVKSINVPEKNFIRVSVVSKNESTNAILDLVFIQEQNQ